MNPLLELTKNYQSPTYCYDTDLLEDTIEECLAQSKNENIKVHYAIKANANPLLLKIIAKKGLGADCVSVGEIERAITCGFKPQDIVFAGVGKRDDEISYAIENQIGCINVESIQEIEVINEIAKQLKATVNIALRISPEIDAHTHSHITTGLQSNKFGIALDDTLKAAQKAQQMSHLKLKGLHFHIGSQICEMKAYEKTCLKVNEIILMLEEKGFFFEHINMGGGLGVNYDIPDNDIPNFKAYFDTLTHNLNITSQQKLHCELGRSIIAQCGILVCKVLYVKEKGPYKFIILDAGFTDLLRPAFYQAHHRIRNISAKEQTTYTYNIVGPICESSDIFATNYKLPITKRNDYIVIDSCGAYGESMASQYNLRQFPRTLIYSLSKLNNGSTIHD